MRRIVKQIKLEAHMGKALAGSYMGTEPHLENSLYAFKVKGTLAEWVQLTLCPLSPWL